MKKLLTSLLVAGVLVGAVYGAAAALDVGGVDELGSGTATVASPDGTSTVEVSDVTWDIDAADITMTTGATVTIKDIDDDATAETCDVGLHVDDGGSGFDAVNTGETTSPTTLGGTKDSAFAVVLAVVDIGSVTVTLACEA